tara:strand:+ start:568 stop:810 length:243 start_codon:yes stop_codon:yes gene_type:complete
MPEIKIKTEIRHSVFRMPTEYFLLPEIQKQFDTFETLNMSDSSSPDMYCYVGVFNSIDLMGFPVSVSIFSNNFKKETNGK